ncbi:MAG: hypothetical protein OXQ89_23415, partial [Rhodospirillaceae bacterium]|nr:hypothetical protein [Rhodospirillaceae bacterium]
EIVERGFSSAGELLAHLDANSVRFRDLRVRIARAERRDARRMRVMWWLVAVGLSGLMAPLLAFGLLQEAGIVLPDTPVAYVTVVGFLVGIPALVGLMGQLLRDFVEMLWEDAQSAWPRYSPW